MMDDEELFYLAGFLDGEGCFYANMNRYCKVNVCATNAYYPTIKRLHELFGGSIRLDKKQKSHHKQLYTWRVADRKATTACQVLAPYLREKAEQALLIIAIGQTRGGGHLSDETLNERNFLASRLKELKHE